MFWMDFLYICLNKPAALEHGKIVENTVCFQAFGKISELEHCKTCFFWERFYGDKWINYCALKETIAKFAKTCQQRGIWRFCGKMWVTAEKCCLDSSSAHCRRGYLKFPSSGSPRRGKCEKNTYWQDPREREIVAPDGPGRGWREMFQRFFGVIYVWIGPRHWNMEK